MTTNPKKIFVVIVWISVINISTQVDKKSIVMSSGAFYSKQSCNKIIMELVPFLGKGRPDNRHTSNVQDGYRHTQKRSMRSKEGIGFRHV